MILEIAAAQDGVTTRRQALAAGMTIAAIRSSLEAGRWQRIYPGTYATFSGAVPRPAQLWAAVLTCGHGAVLSHHTAAELAGLVKPEGIIHVTVPGNRRVAKVDGIRLHHSARVGQARHPSLRPPRTRAEATVIDLASCAPTVDQAVAWISRAIGSRLTTAQRLAHELQSRAKVRFRRDLNDALTDAAGGTHSVLEWRYLRDVERRHKLPKGTRQQPFRGTRQDVAYDDFLTVVELDGLTWHRDTAHRDMRRDNRAATHGLLTLRYGWADVAGTPCAVAAQVATVLLLRGWAGAPARCGKQCVIR